MSEPSSGVADAEAAAQDLLSEQGAYSPIELLLATSNLDYDDYRAWREGDRPTLDGALTAGLDGTRKLVQQVDAWARSLHLQAEQVPFFGIERNAGVELTASVDAELDGLLHTEYRALADRRQLDLFLDTTDTVAVNNLVTALSARDAAKASARLEDLRELDARHWMLHDVTVLIDALTAPPPAGRAHALRLMRTLEQQWLPAASAVLRAGARDFVTPMWRRVGVALDDGAPFDAALPREHASWAYLNGLDWINVRRSVADVADHRSEPVLLERLAEAEWRLRNRRAALASWFALCWLAPQRFATAVRSGGVPDTPLRNGWQRMQDEEWDVPVTADWLPAWMVLAEPGVARAFKPLHGDSPPERAFDLLLRLGAGVSDREDIDSRRALQEIHPQIFDRYLLSIEA